MSKFSSQDSQRGPSPTTTLRSPIYNRPNGRLTVDVIDFNPTKPDCSLRFAELLASLRIQLRPERGAPIETVNCWHRSAPRVRAGFNGVIGRLHKLFFNGSYFIFSTHQYTKTLLWLRQVPYLRYGLQKQHKCCCGRPCRSSHLRRTPVYRLSKT